MRCVGASISAASPQTQHGCTPSLQEGAVANCTILDLTVHGEVLLHPSSVSRHRVAVLRHWDGPVHVTWDDFPALHPSLVQGAVSALADSSAARRAEEWQQVTGEPLRAPDTADWEGSAGQWEALAGVTLSTTQF